MKFNTVIAIMLTLFICPSVVLAYTSVEVGDYWWDGDRVIVELYRPESVIGVSSVQNS